MSFSKERKQAEKFLYISNNNDKNLSKVLYILENDNNLGYNLSTHGDIEEISFYPNEKEVLFFPFSSFEIQEINPVNKKGYEYKIQLKYLGKYLEEILNDKNIIMDENKIPDSKFKNQISEFGLIKNEKINIKTLYGYFMEYKKEINWMLINSMTRSNPSVKLYNY